MNDLMEIFDRIKEQAKTSLLKDGEVEPVVFMITSEGVGVIPCNYETREEKTRFFSTCRKILQEKEAEAAILVTESWVKATETLEEIDPHKPISEYPDKTEAILVMLESPTFCTVVMIPFSREGERINLEKEEIMPDAISPMFNLYKQTRH